MSEATTFANDYFAQTAKLIQALEDLRILNDRMTQDNTLVQRYFVTLNHRTDIDEQAFTAAKAAVVQILFAYDSGNPAQKAALFNLL